MKRVLLDTNALMAMAQFRIDIFTEVEKVLDEPYQIGVLSATIAELEKNQAEQAGKHKWAAKLALSIIKAKIKVKKILMIREAGMVDELLVKHSQEGDLVLTQDRELKKRLSKPYLTIRQKRRVVMVR